MIFDGIRFTRNNTIWSRPCTQHTHLNGGDYREFYYIRSGRVIPMSGHSLTNMAYARDGRTLLHKSGIVYTAPKRPLGRKL